MRVLVTQPLFAQDVTKTKLQPSEALSLGYLIASLRAAGIEAEPLDAHMLGIPNEECADLVDRRGCSLVGISCSAQRALPETAHMARTLKARRPDLHITVGGQFASHAHEQLLAAEPAFDSVVRGEGEHTFPVLIERVARGAGLHGLPGVSFRDDGRVVVNPPARRIEDLDAIPFPDRSYIESILDEALAGVRYVSMMGTRGCIYKCTFCSVDRPRAVRTPANIVAELRDIHERWGVWKFMFNDDLLVGGTPAMQTWAEELADRIVAEVPGLELWGMTRADAVRPQLFSKLRDAGFTAIFVGVESASDDVLRRFRKGTRARTNERAIQVLKEVGIRPELGFIMLEPHMTWGDVRKNLDFLERADCFTRHNLTNRLNIYHGAPLYHAAVEARDVDPSDDLTERYPYDFDDPLVKVYSDALNALKRATFDAKHGISQASVRLKETQVDLCRQHGPQTREWPRVAALKDTARRLERLEARRWLDICKELCRRIEGGDDASALVEEMPPYAAGVLADVVTGAARLERQIEEVARTSLVEA